MKRKKTYYKERTEKSLKNILDSVNAEIARQRLEIPKKSQYILFDCTMEEFKKRLKNDKT
jgi:hypothetical protein